MDYIEFNGLAYNAVWSLGCPFSCTYCSNSGFEQINKHYLKLRYSKPESIIKEIEYVKSKYTWINRINFHDDNLIALPIDVLKYFCELYKKRINMPFSVYGIHPNTISKDKIKLLASNGMIRVRMGIQSGNERILDFYNRNTTQAKINSAVEILADATKKYKMIPPTYDIITDNPLEKKEDMIINLRFLNKMKRPFTFNIFSLRPLVGTRIYDYFVKNDIKCSSLSYAIIDPTLNNILIHLIPVVKIPNLFFEHFLKKVEDYGYQKKDILYYCILHVFLIYLVEALAI